MSKFETMLALCVLAATVLVGCKQPSGLAGNDVHIASTETTYCFVANDTNLTGYVSKYMDGQTPNGWYTMTPGSIIERGLEEVGGYVYPKTYGYCVFEVPEFESPAEVLVCTLYYKQKEHVGSLNLVFNWLSGISSWTPTAGVLWNAIDTSSYALAPAQGVQADGWCKLALSGQGCAWLEDYANSGGGSFPTGWKFSVGIAGWYTRVWGVTDDAVAPYMKVVYSQ
ncbi:hypothetical protein FJY68_12115 [candidate division WOR-3 bacterium]|uniref:Uncharacterized protein n=1 Tax=candidate division WOR-3 bacterium TaxID=2052148 RepID=A0A937XHG4_UNCW3|nr:hypothetical protein [candidate division WOR-3 bacterium]